MYKALIRHAGLAGALLLAGCGGNAETAADTAAVSADKQGFELSTPVANADLEAIPGLAPAGFGKRSALVADGTVFEIDTADREAVRLFFNRIYAEPVPSPEWTGDYVTGMAGTTSAAFKSSVLQRTNWFRVMAGVPTLTGISAANSEKAQQAALMMSANGALSHYPTSSWTFYTAAGAQAAAASNLSLGRYGPEAVSGLVGDGGSNNGPVGHRRWILYPRLRSLGTGDVPGAVVNGKSYAPAHVMWVHDVGPAGSAPTPRDGFVAWPSRGYVPYQVVWPRWSLSYAGADFSKAQVTVQRDGAPVPVRLEEVHDGYADNTIVWEVNANTSYSPHPRPAADTTYRVSVSNVAVAGQLRSFEYEVIVFDPAVMKPHALQPSVNAPAMVQAGGTYTVRINAAPSATGYRLRSYRRNPSGATAALPLDAPTWTTSAGKILGGAALKFYYDAGELAPQHASLQRTLFVASQDASAVFTRSVGWVTPGQGFALQVSLDGGASWIDAHAETGAGGMGKGAESITASLSRFAGRIVQLRFMAEASGSRYQGPTSGWTVSGIRLAGVDELLDQHELADAGGTFTLSPAMPGNYLLSPYIQLQHGYSTDPGTPAPVAVDGALLKGPRSAYTITRQDGVLTITDNQGQDGVQTVRQPFRLDFSDVSLAFDVDGNAGRSYRLYRAAFDRKPDVTGLGFWIRAMDGGLGMEAIALEFVRSAEFAGLFGAAPSNEEIIAGLYRNVLHRLPDQAGAAFWLQQMARGMTRERLLVEFSESAENKAQVASEIALGIAFARQ